MKKFLFLISALMIGIGLNAQGDLDLRMRSAIEKMDQGMYSNAISQLEGVVKDYPKLFVPRYELAYALMLNKDYQKAYDCLKKAKGCKDKTDQWYQLMGTLEDYLGSPDKCMKTFQKGLKEFPNSGLLHVEMGMAYQAREQYNEAVSHYLSGIERDPMFPSNYFRAANLYLSSSMPIWGLMLGEMYMLLDPYSQRADAVSSNLSGFMRQAVTLTDTSVNVKLGSQFNIFADPKTMAIMMPFEVSYSLHADLSAVPAAIKGRKTLDVETLTLMHRALMESFVADSPKSLSQKHGDILFPYLKRIDEAGFFDVYCHLLYRGMGDEAANWLQDHSFELEAFQKWLQQNRFVVTTATAFTPRTAKAFNMLEAVSE